MGGSAPCCCCGITLQKGTQIVGVVDVILGMTNSYVLAIHVKEKFEFDDSPDSKYTHSYLHWMPPGLSVAILVAYLLQALMGIVLFVGAINKSRRVCYIYLGITALTAVFTGVFIRLYEMAVVYQYSHELKQEEEVTYFPGYQPHQAQPDPQHMANLRDHQIIPPIQPCVSVISPIPTFSQPPTILNGIKYYGHNQYQRPIPPTQMMQPPVPPPQMLQPPPQYEAAMNDSRFQYSGFSGGMNAYNPQGASLPMFPNEKTTFPNTFKQF